MQILEALTSQIADTTQEVLRPRFVGVVIEAAHQCMTTRRIREPGVSLATSACSAAFRDDPTRREPGPRPYQEEITGASISASARRPRSRRDSTSP